MGCTCNHTVIVSSPNRVTINGLFTSGIGDYRSKENQPCMPLSLRSLWGRQIEYQPGWLELTWNTFTCVLWGV